MKRVINKNKVFYLIMGVLILVVLVVTGVRVVNEFFIKDDKEVVSKKELDNLDSYGYSLDDFDTKLYKEYFNSLKKVLSEEEIDMKKYATLLSQLFITDFYTLDNKITSSDIGGTEFIHPDMKDNFVMRAGDTLYNHVKNNAYGDRKQELPIVKQVNVDSVESTTYAYNNKEYEGFKVVATWEYEKDLGYDKGGTLYLIKDNDKLNVVEKN